MKVRNELVKRAQRSQANLHSDSKTLEYELVMLLQVPLQLALPHVKDSQHACNALIESFAIHCRALVFFFFGHLDSIEADGESEKMGKLRETDVIAVDFLKDWPTISPQPNGLLVEAKRQADKHVAHITTDRREINKPHSCNQSEWRLVDVASAIAGIMNCFLRDTPRHQFAPSSLEIMQSALSVWSNVTAS